MNQCEIKKEAGEHGHAVISGYISADNEKGYLQMACESNRGQDFCDRRDGRAQADLLRYFGGHEDHA